MFSTEQPQQSVIGPNSVVAEMLNMDITLKANATIAAGNVVSISAVSNKNTSASAAPEGAVGFVASNGSNNAALAVAADAQGDTRKIMAVALADAVSGQVFKARVRGVCLVKTSTHTAINYGGGSFTVGATAGEVIVLNPTAGNAQAQIGIAIPIELSVTGGSTLMMVDGLYGFTSSGI